jgi:hypothetical protein
MSHATGARLTRRVRRRAACGSAASRQAAVSGPTPERQVVCRATECHVS